jgi:drug/metabolite transporter (DMT)-like permease
VTRRAWLLFAAMCVIWGVPYLLIKVAVRDMSPVVLVFSRTALGALILLPVAASRNQLRPLLRLWKPLLAYTAVEVAIPWWLLSTAEQHLSSSLTGLLIAAVPLVGAVLAWLTGSADRLGPLQLGGLLIGLGGVAAVVGLDVGHSDLAAAGLVGLVAVGYALGPFTIRRYLADAPPLGVVAASLALTALVYAPIAAAQWPHRFPPAEAVEAVVALVVVCTVLAFLLFFALIAEIGPVRSTVITYVNPAVAVFLGVTVLGETLRPGMVVGFALILTGSFFATRRSGASDDAGTSAAVQTAP